VRECQGNFIETCALKLYPNDFATKSLPFIICLETNSNDWTAQGKKCATQVGVSWDDISACSTSKQGNTWEAEFGDLTDNLVPKHTYVPWVVVNNQHTESSENAVISNMVRYVCSIYKGTEKIAACK
jgi:interferon gamma-inducible protein 30